MLVRKLSPIGNNQGLILDPALLELLEIDDRTELELDVRDGALVVRPMRKRQRLDRIRAAAERAKAH